MLLRLVVGLVRNLSNGKFWYQINRNRHNQYDMVGQVDGGFRDVRIDQCWNVGMVDRELNVGFRGEGEGRFDKRKVEKLLDLVIWSLASDELAGLDDHGVVCLSVLEAASEVGDHEHPQEVAYSISWVFLSSEDSNFDKSGSMGRFLLDPDLLDRWGWRGWDRLERVVHGLEVNDAHSSRWWPFWLLDGGAEHHVVW